MLQDYRNKTRAAAGEGPGAAPDSQTAAAGPFSMPAGYEQGVTASQGPVSEETLRQFAPKFKAAIEKVWSGGHIKPAHAIDGVTVFTTKTNVAVVDSGEHMIFYVTPEELGVSFVAKDRSYGKLGEHANEEKSETCGGVDPTGKHPVTMTNTQVGSAHEFGHAVGLAHPRPGGYDGQSCDPAYGKTEEERGSIMGAGHELRVIKRAGIDHNDYGPFISIGEKWGSEILPASLASRNKWSAA